MSCADLTFTRSQSMPKPEPNPPQQPPPSKRTTSVRIASTRSTNVGQSRLRSGGSVVVRDTDEEEEESSTQSKPDATKIPQPVSQPQPITRTRKAKETQLRLGVGRPKAVGGIGARAVTKSFSLPKNNKRVSKNIKISEATIPEEQDPGMFTFGDSIDFCAKPTTSELQPTNQRATNHTTSPPVAQTTPVAQGPSQNFDKINEYMQNIVSLSSIHCALLLTAPVRYALYKSRCNTSNRSLRA